MNFQSEYTYVTSTLIKKQNITRTLEALFVLYSPKDNHHPD